MANRRGRSVPEESEKQLCYLAPDEIDCLAAMVKIIENDRGLELSLELDGFAEAWEHLRWWLPRLADLEGRSVIEKLRGTTDTGAL